MKFRDRLEAGSAIGTGIGSILVSVFLVGIILIYHNMLQEAVRSNIRDDVELTAMVQADRFEEYLSTNTDLLEFTAYTLDEMLSEGRTDAEIQTYLVDQSVAIKKALLEDSTGLYGYINGKFVSGTNWVPYAGYVATERPWYTNAIAGGGELTMLEPYHDVQSGNTMLAVGKSLSDGESVISVDISLKEIQELTEAAVKHENDDTEMILTGNGIVVAHSDPREIGKDYSLETGTLGARIYTHLHDTGEHYFEFSDSGESYIISAADFHKEWHCISVHNATEAFGRLKRILAATIAIVVITLIVIGIIMGVSRRRSVIAEKAMATSDAKSAFLSNMSHEIRTPINTMLGLNEMILRESGEERILTYADNINRAGQTLLSMVNNVLDFAKIETGKLEIIPSDYDLSSVLNDLVNMISMRTDEKGLSLKLDFDRNIPKLLYGDEIRIKQVIAHLLTNAVKYTDEGGITFAVKYEKPFDEVDSIVLKVIVKDTGAGIKEENIKSLFDRFEDMPDSMEKGVEGSGLGMNITVNLLQMMGSALKVESVYGIGSDFSFELKQKVIAWEPIGDFEQAYKKAMEDTLDYRESFEAPEAEVMVVDDNPMNHVVFKGLLKHTRIRIQSADSGDECLTLAGDSRFDIIFLDHMMPGKDGIETLKELKAAKDGPNANTPVICLTANAISGARERYLEAGFDDYITKPIDTAKLERLILKYLPEDKVGKSVPASAKTEDESAGAAVVVIPDELKALEGQDIVSVSTGLKNCKYLDTYMQLLRLFYTSVDERAEELKTFCEEGDLKNYTIRIHGLKSSARIIGASELGEEAFRLEEAGKRQDTDYIREHQEVFFTLYRQVKDILALLFNNESRESVSESSGSDKPQADSAVLSGAYERIREAADDMDCDKLKDIISQMDTYSIPETEKDLWQRIVTATEQFDYDTILELLKE